MGDFLAAAGSWLRRRAENVAAALLAIMFVAFIVQIVFRYLFNFPIGWTSELTIVTWVWIVLWGAAFVLRESDEIRFDLAYAAVGRRVRRAFVIVSSVALIGLYAYSLPAAYDYVSFMKVQSTTYLRIRYDVLFSIYVIFSGAIILRYLWILGRAALRDADPVALAPSSGL
jgi:TRAP-type C4-dicarboxylate transport system permease small subunit